MTNYLITLESLKYDNLVLFDGINTNYLII